MKVYDLIGKKFSKLTVIERAEKPANRKDISKFWLCKCDCGCNKDIIISTGDLTSGKIKSCGCLQKEKVIIFNKESKKKYNKYDLSGEYGIGYTYKGEEFYFDLEDYNIIKNYCWNIDGHGYVINIKNLDNKIYITYFHRLVMNCPINMTVDHINTKIKYDNRKKNLRICTNQENSCNSPLQLNNTSGKTGVYWYKKYNMWKAEITFKNKRIHLGYFMNFDDAVKVRTDAEIKYFDKFRNKNS